MIGGLFFSDADCCPLDFFDFFCDDDDIFSVVARSITDTDYSLAQCLSLPLSLLERTVAFLVVCYCYLDCGCDFLNLFWRAALQCISSSYIVRRGSSPSPAPPMCLDTVAGEFVGLVGGTIGWQAKGTRAAAAAASPV